MQNIKERMVLARFPVGLLRLALSMVAKPTPVNANESDMNFTRIAFLASETPEARRGG